MPQLGPQEASAVASFIIAVCDGLALQWFIDPDAVPAGQELSAALTEDLSTADQ